MADKIFASYKERDKKALGIIDVIIADEDSVKSDSEVKRSKIVGNYFPYLSFHDQPYDPELGHIGLTIKPNNILNFQLTSKQFLPTLYLKFVDKENTISSYNFIVDATVLNLYIRGNNEKLLKPLHLNMDVISISPSGMFEESKVYTVTCQLRVPYLYSENCAAYPELSSFDALLKIAEELNLGFYSNEEDTSDIMTWINPYTTNFEFIKAITDTAYKDLNSFFTSHIDVYYNLTLTNLNACFGKEEAEEAEAYTGISDIKNPEETFEKMPLYITNLVEFDSMSRYITNYKMNNSSSRTTIENGYQRKLQYYNMIDNTYLTDSQMDIIPIIRQDVLEGEHVAYGGINSHPTEDSKNYIDKYIKYKFLGKQNENVHDFYKYSKIWNYHNLSTTSQNVLIVDLKGVDLSIYRYQTLPVIIYEYDALVNRNLEVATGKKANRVQVNDYLSGKYIVLAIDWIYSYPGTFFQRLYLTKRTYINYNKEQK